jgi:hypothetical protein
MMLGNVNEGGMGIGDGMMIRRIGSGIGVKGPSLLAGDMDLVLMALEKGAASGRGIKICRVATEIAREVWRMYGIVLDVLYLL